METPQWNNPVYFELITQCVRLHAPLWVNMGLIWADDLFSFECAPWIWQIYTGQDTLAYMSTNKCVYLYYVGNFQNNGRHQGKTQQ